VLDWRESQARSATSAKSKESSANQVSPILLVFIAFVLTFLATPPSKSCFPTCLQGTKGEICKSSWASDWVFTKTRTNPSGFAFWNYGGPLNAEISCPSTRLETWKTTVTARSILWPMPNVWQFRFLSWLRQHSIFGRVVIIQELSGSWFRVASECKEYCVVKQQVHIGRWCFRGGLGMEYYTLLVKAPRSCDQLRSVSRKSSLVRDKRGFPPAIQRDRRPLNFQIAKQSLPNQWVPIFASYGRQLAILGPKAMQRWVCDSKMPVFVLSSLLVACWTEQPSLTIGVTHDSHNSAWWAFRLNDRNFGTISAKWASRHHVSFISFNMLPSRPWIVLSWWRNDLSKFSNFHILHIWLH
jgi:hypothetical protein